VSIPPHRVALEHINDNGRDFDISTVMNLAGSSVEDLEMVDRSLGVNFRAHFGSALQSL
jgi:hypothetical protein